MAKTDDASIDYLALKVGDEWRGEHIDIIYRAADRYFVYSSKEKPDKVHYDFLKDDQKPFLDALEPDMSTLGTLLHDHPDRAKYLSQVAAIYVAALDGNVDLAKQLQTNLINMIGQPVKIPDGEPAKNATEPPVKPDARRNIWIAIVSGLIALGCVAYYIHLLQGPANLPFGQLFYLILILFGVAVSALLFGVMNSSGSLEGKKYGATYKFTGPIVGVILVVFGGFYLPTSGSSATAAANTLTVRVIDSTTNPVGRGTVQLIYTTAAEQPKPLDKDSQVAFANIAEQNFSHPIKIIIRSPGFTTISTDTLVKKNQLVEFILHGGGAIEISGKITNAGEAPVGNAKVFIEGDNDTATTVTDGTYYLQVNRRFLNMHVKIKAVALGYDAKEIGQSIDNESIPLNITLAPAKTTEPISMPAGGHAGKTRPAFGTKTNRPIHDTTIKDPQNSGLGSTFPDSNPDLDIPDPNHYRDRLENEITTTPSLMRDGKDAFYKQDYGWSKNFYKACKALRSGQWMQDYPFFAADYFLTGHNDSAIILLNEMNANVGRPNTFLSHPDPIRFLLENLGAVEKLLPPDQKKILHGYIDKVRSKMSNADG